MRQLRRAISDCIYCRMKRSTAYLVLFLLLFVYINYHFLHPLFTNSLPPQTTVSSLTQDDTALHEQYRQFAEERQRVLDGVQAKENVIRKHLFPFRRHEEIDQNKIDIKKEPAPVAPVKKEPAPVAPVVVQKPSEPSKPAAEPHMIQTTQKVEIPVPQPTLTLKKPVMAVLVISCNRVEVSRSLDLILKYKPKNVEIPVIVSQDCGHGATAKVIQGYGDKVTHIKQPELGDVAGVPPNLRRFMTYHKISRHYKWALTQVFNNANIDSVVIVEDDLEIAPDFFDYFLATRPLLDDDPTLFCVSAWNDNGKPDLIDESAVDLIHRSDFFPGLGWLLTRKVWLELAPKWPLGFWDDWLRQRGQRKERACLRPEISRTRTFGRVGASEGQFFDQYLRFIKLNDKPYPFLEYDLNHLLKPNYDKKFLDRVYSVPEQHNDLSDAQAIRISYSDKWEFERIARQYGMMSDEKEGVPRTAYLGVVSIYRNKKRIYIAPKVGWKPY